ncbi:recombination regulator RecX [Deinococcus metallilatus]|uniref:Regulatory protein RecX n=1 Tax=Deinococcus metallilatus TaxID=1211322 RepID=A0AAJ5K4B2_9DEIO|nr:RecX family transcriptional regulator [Deinococcus metallilatus]MBB5296482.1 regulatory protein [Deinococcus metallilatus]QBY08485.1 recombination regulator RecX [Deinococcus metallilatus]RXJ11284.1 recombination regulator RecX [Deinococcus metallilatus]TLK24775.1 recombination regulator RecX [Deinococcus metallilatus]GMA17399.1 regulatory protein RecX [Deinococcus metallilatus]
MTGDRPPTPEDRQKARDDLLAYAFRALSGRALTEAELRTRLRRRTDDEALAEEVLARVQELGYQSDDAVARAEGGRRGVGGFRVRQTLKRRGVTEGLIEETLAARDPEEEQADAAALLSRRWPSFARKRDPRASAYAFLARRGFPGAVIWAAIREVASAEGDPLLDEAALDDDSGLE